MACETEAEAAEEQCARAEAAARVSRVRGPAGCCSRPSVARLALLKSSHSSPVERLVREDGGWVETPSCCSGTRISKVRYIFFSF